MNLADIRIRTAGDEPRLAAALADALIDCLEGGASVSFMQPLPHWQRCGEIPGYALWPQGGLCSTTTFLTCRY